jgi:hypothetical protein
MSLAGDRTRMVLRDTGRGFFELMHNSFALVGLVVAIGLVVVGTRQDLRHTGETKLVQWLQSRQPVALVPDMNIEPDAIERATATNPKDLPKQQAAVAFWLANKYRVAPEPMAALVAEAHDLSQSTKIDAHLILAIAAVESSFNPFAQSPVGAQGLMQVMTHIHADKYSHFGGKLAAFDPVTNLRVGVKVLQECVRRAGSLDAGLKYYVGAALHDTDGGYAAKVYAEAARIRDVAGGKSVPYLSGSPQFAVNANPGSADSQRINAEAAALLRNVSADVSEPAAVRAAQTTGAHSLGTAPAAAPVQEPAADPTTLNKM